jgi:hypothetical protein
MSSVDWVPTEVNLTKRLSKMIARIERIMVSVSTMVHSNLGQKLGVLTKLIERGNYYTNANSIIKKLQSGRKIVSKSSTNAAGTVAEIAVHKVVKWDELKKDIIEVISYGDLSFVVPPKVLGEMNTEHNLHVEEDDRLRAKEKLRYLQVRNNQPVVSGRWRKDPYAPREYEFLSNYAVTTTVSEEEGETLKEQLITPLNGFLGQAYNYDDHGLTEEWMVSFKDGSSGASDADIIRTQIESLLEIMMVQVVDRVCTADGVLDRAPLQLGVGQQIKESFVWGIDCYTRRMVELAIEDNVVPKELYNETNVTRFIEKQLLPSINAQESNKAHNMYFALQSINQNKSPLNVYDVPYSLAVLGALQEHGSDLFKIHPKGIIYC